MNHSTDTVFRPEVMTYADSPLPPFPPITDILTQLPDQSDPIVIATSPVRLLLYANSDNSGNSAYVADIPGTMTPGNYSFLKNYWGDGPARQYTLTLRRYWRQVPGTYTLVLPGGAFKKTFTTSHGISTTDSQSLSAELGVEGGGLSAKISATFSHSVTVSDATQESSEFSAGEPPPNSQRVWIIWQLVEEIVALDSNGAVIPASDGREGDVVWLTIFPSFSGAWLSYPNVQQPFPTTVFMPQQKDFPNP